MKIKLKDAVLALFLISLGILTRTIFHVGPNIEFVTAVSLAAGYFIKNKALAMSVPLFTLFVSDIIIGNTLIYLFTWSSFFVSTILGVVFSKKDLFKINNKFAKNALMGEGLGIVSTLIFFFWTNFGVVLTTNMYEKNLTGVISSYINGLPFLLNQLLSNLLIVPVIFLGVTLAYMQKYKELNMKSAS
jgi:hypothetical protein